MFNNISRNYSGIDDVTVEVEDPAWILHFDRTQLVMTIIGLLANIGTTITLMVNGQVCNDQVYCKVVKSSLNITIMLNFDVQIDNICQSSEHRCTKHQQ